MEQAANEARADCASAHECVARFAALCAALAHPFARRHELLAHAGLDENQWTFIMRSWRARFVEQPIRAQEFAVAHAAARSRMRGQENLHTAVCGSCLESAASELGAAPAVTLEATAPPVSRNVPVLPFVAGQPAAARDRMDLTAPIPRGAHVDSLEQTLELAIEPPPRTLPFVKPPR